MIHNTFRKCEIIAKLLAGVGNLRSFIPATISKILLKSQFLCANPYAHAY